jgi:excisionase family DNA binding protein
MAIPAKHYSVKRLATERWGCSLSHVYDLIDNEELKALKIGKTYRIPVAFVEEYEGAHLAWQEQGESESNTDSENTENTSTSAGPKTASLSGSQRAQVTLLTQKPLRQITSRS